MNLDSTKNKMVHNNICEDVINEIASYVANITFIYINKRCYKTIQIIVKNVLSNNYNVKYKIEKSHELIHTYKYFSKYNMLHKLYDRFDKQKLIDWVMNNRYFGVNIKRACHVVCLEDFKRLRLDTYHIFAIVIDAMLLHFGYSIYPKKYIAENLYDYDNKHILPFEIGFHKGYKSRITSSDFCIQRDIYECVLNKIKTMLTF